MPTHYKGSKDVVRALNVYINLARASDSILGRLSLHSEAHGLTLGQFGILESLLHLGPMCQVDIGKKLLRSGGNITTVLDNLERRNLVCRERQKGDRRKILVRLTASGRRLIADYFPSHAEAIAKEMMRLSPKEQEQLRRLCRKLGRGSAAQVLANKENNNDRRSPQ
jgi:MarR family transcriptional regulator, 2-MHQ and catechol-resistance regulon repressor